MNRKSGDQPLDALERRFQALRDQVGALEACRPELETALQELSQAIATLRADREPEARPPTAIPNCETILKHVFNAVPDLLTIHDRDFNTILSNWHGYESVPEAERQGQPKCYRAYHHRDRPCDDCHALEVLATGQPVRLEKVNPVDGRIREVSAYPIRDESGRVVLVVEHVRDITERHLAEQSLKDSEARFRTLIEDSPESLFLTDVQGTILAASRVAARRLGKNLDEIIGAFLFDPLPPEVTTQRRARFEQVIATGRPVRFEDVRGSVHFDNHINPILDAGGKVSRLSILGINITDRKNAEQALKEREALFRAIFATAQDSIFIKDRSFRYTQVNPAMERLYGLSAVDLTGKTDLDLVGAADTEHIRKQDRRVLNGEVVKGVHTIPVQGVPITFHYIKAPLHDEAGEIVGICGIARDITDLRQAEAALEESEERFRMLFDHVPDAYILADMQGEIIDCNQATEELAGYGREELVGNNFACLPWLDFRQQVRLADLLAQTARGGVMGPVDFTLTHKDGGEVIAEGMSLPLSIQGQNLVLTIVRDITARKQAEEALAAHLQFLELLLDTIPNPIFFKDAQGAYLGCNKAFEVYLGVTREEIVGKSVYDLSHKELADEYHRMDLEAFQTTGTQVYESRVQVADGTWHHVVFHKATFPDPTGGVGGLVGIITDITARKQAEEALWESEARFRAIFENAPVGISMTDLSGRLLQTNRVLQALLGYTAEELRGRESPEIIHPEDRPENARLGMELLAGNHRHYSMDNRLLRKDGEIIWGQVTVTLLRDARGDPEYFVGTVIDITAQKQSETELRQSEQRFRLMAETIQDVFWIATPRIGKTVYVSPGFEYIWGRTREALYRNPKLFLETVHPEDRERVKTEIIAARERSIPWSHEYRIIRPDGTARWILNRGFPVRDDQGRVILFTGVATDITEHKALEEQLLQAQKMEAVGRLAGGVAHDFNNLLMAITGYGELMRAKVLKDDPLYGYLENILKAGERAASLTRQLLTFSRRQIIHPKMIDLNRVILDLEPMLRRLIGEDLHLEVVTDRRLGTVRADPSQVDQIVMNLVLNARDAMPTGGGLTLKTAAVELKKERHTRFGLAPPGAYVMLVVEDTGVGMDEVTQAHIFEPFFTTKGPGKGTGLGLSTVYGIVKQSGGYLDLESSPGAGSAFTIYLPRLEAIVDPPRVKIAITESLRGEETILLVEDEDMLRGLLAKFLRLYDYTVLEARHGGEALLACERHPGPIHLMVTDVVMPQMSGRELADRLTPLRPEMKVLYMSGYTEDALVQHGVADLSVAFLQKPFRPIELARRVHALLHPSVSH
jgi:PAS domain S-box-containing protein